MTKQEKLQELKFYLGMHQYQQQGYFPHPGHQEDIERLKKEIVELEKEIASESK